MLARARSMGMDLAPHIESGQLQIFQIDPAELSPGEFASWVRTAVEEEGVTFLVIDSLNAFMQAMPGEKYLLLQMHELLSYLNQQGAITMLVLGQHGIIGEVRSDVDLSYLSDTIVLFRYFEARGSVLKAISVAKSRTSAHESTIREFRLGAGGLRIGEPLADFEGVLTGLPNYRGATAPDGRRRSAVAAVEERVLVLAQRGRDAAVISQLLTRQGYQCCVCDSGDDLAQRLAEGAGAALVTEESLAETDRRALSRWLADQPPWSDFPFILLATKRAGRRTKEAARVLEQLGNVVVLERPIHGETLASAAFSALRGRRRQYEMCESDRRKDEFLAMLGHELRNPLAPILHGARSCCAARAARSRAGRARPRRHRAPGAAPRAGWSTICSTSRASRTGKIELRACRSLELRRGRRARRAIGRPAARPSTATSCRCRRRREPVLVVRRPGRGSRRWSATS